MGGLCWCFCVGHHSIPDEIRNAYVKEDGRFWLMPMNADGFLFEFSRKAVRQAM